MTRTTWIALALALFAQASVAQTPPAADPRIHVVVIHTNDVHGQVLPRRATWLHHETPPQIGGLPRLAAYVNAMRAEAQREGAGILVVDAGDWYQGTPEGLVDAGLGFVLAQAQVRYDAMCIGNHELDHGLPNLLRILRAAEVPAVCANLEVRATGKPVDWVPPVRIVETGGLEIAIVGLLTPITPEITHPDARELVFVEPAQALARVAKGVEGKVDWILPLTHLGVESDRALARSRPDLPLIVGGHSHTYLKDGVREGSTLIVQAGSKASAVGRVDVWLDRRTRKVVESRAQLVDLLDEPQDAFRNRPLEALCTKLEEKSAERMKEVVGELEAPLLRGKDPLASSTAGNFITDALREHTRADVALMNRGGIRADVEAGPVTRRALFELLPFDNAVSVVALSGAELQDFLRRAVEGTAHSGVEVSGVVLEVRAGTGGKRELIAVQVGGKLLDPEARYKVAMNSFMADGGDAYMDRKEPPARVDEPTLMREMLEARIAAKKTAAPDGTNRYLVRTP